MIQSKVIATIFAVAVFASSGCGPSGPDMGHVFGTVTYEGKPLPTGTVSFVPETEGQPMAFAQIQADGTYEAATKSFGKGVPVGNHRVMITAMKDGGSGEGGSLIQLIPTRYGGDRMSGLKAEVQEGENQIDFQLEK
ncbi:hypothetical protein M4951_15040 [Blastopirellula sp. J2-11]|uniref:hypothetical protein n=1 Tax=Blastopirellula sp. J2-11 TaxID=2943192 RepID=UPI0021CAA16C|nr:hypothetical protein [Blastopirellula sp. J2-11]UUO04701.1 hypothetical protein M4951_15040 [Blastopirellula sp. J2-11]